MTRIKSNVYGSYKDPDGFIFTHKGSLFRQVNQSYKDNYNSLISSGLYEKLVKEKLLIPHEEIRPSFKTDSYKTLKPYIIPFVSYPYEWCFSQLKDAALTTLAIQKKALELDMVLKDASAFNIQFIKGKPIFIDSLSFERYYEGKPWVAYRQFCEHFLAPLALMSYTKVNFNRMSSLFLDGIPLNVAASLLPLRAKLRFGVFSHIILHAKSQRIFSSKTVSKKQTIGKNSLLGIIDSLRGTINGLSWDSKQTEWSDYYTFTNYSKKSMDHKERVVYRFLQKCKAKVVWDIGANTGVFSNIASRKANLVISIDNDPGTIERLYLDTKKSEKQNILPLVIDIVNPSPSVGWAGEERMSLLQRGSADVVLALALIHHFTITKNVPFDKIASFFSKICKMLIIEFVPKKDSQVKKMLANRQDIFNNYNQNFFEKEFQKYFTILQSEKIVDSQRVIYLMITR